MKGFWAWFKSSTKVKRWIFLILIGIALTCYGMAQILTKKELAINELILIIGEFVAGFILIIIGIVFIQKRTLEILVQANVNPSSKKSINMNSLIFKRKLYENGPKIVVIGGGTGLNTVLEGIKKYTDNITAIVTVSDYGRTASASRQMLNLEPIEDVKGSMIALAENDEDMRKIMKHKFNYNGLNGLNFGDIYIQALKEIYNQDFVEKSSDILKITGKVIPVTNDEINICAELKDGTIVEEKDKISQVVYEKVTKIQRVYITPTNAVPTAGALDAIREADAIIIGPGSLYTNIIPNLLVKNVARTIKESKAMKFYISNIMTEPGQTDDYAISDHIDALVEHVGKGVINYCICDTGEVTPEFVRKYNKMGADVVEQDLKKVSGKGITIIQKDMSVIKDNAIRHDPDVIAACVMETICNDLKYKDKQNNPQYVLLNSKVKDEKKREKKNARNKRRAVKRKERIDKKKEPRFKQKSKFQTKYKERIKSIKNSDKTTASNRQLEENLNKSEEK